jgi:predicted DNA-binding protein YlxM (UPF0122 family)
VGKAQRRMSALDFETTRPLLQSIAARRIEAARAHLVDGETMAAVANRYGWSKSAVHACVNRVWVVWQQYCEARAIATLRTLAPNEWPVVTMRAPHDLIEDFRQVVGRRVFRSNSV